MDIKHWIGCTLAMIGLIIASLSGLLDPENSHKTGNTNLGFFLMTVTLILSGFFYSLQQYYMHKHTFDPVEMIGYEGFFGILIMGGISVILSFVPCNISSKSCVYDSNGNLFMERVDVFFTNILSNWLLGILTLFVGLMFAFHNVSGVRITHLMGSLTRSLLNISKTAVAEILGIILTFAMVGKPEFQIESKNAVVNLVKLVGFGFIAVGTLTYNGFLFQSLINEEDNDSTNQNQNFKVLQEDKIGYEIEKKGI